jgi:hypothetical protein
MNDAEAAKHAQSAAQFSEPRGAAAPPARTPAAREPVSPRRAPAPRHPGPRQDEQRAAVRAELEGVYRRLADISRRLFLAKPHARDMITSLPPLDLPLHLEFSGRPGREADEARRLLDLLETHLDDAILAGCAFRPGRVYCFFCESAECEHSRPHDPRHVFKGFSQTGQPAWWSLLDLAIERQDERVDRLTEGRGAQILLASDRDELVRDRITAFARQEHVYDVRGQIVLGYYHFGEDGARSKFAVTLQLIRSSTRAKVVRVGLNMVGVLPGGRDVEALLGGDRRWPFSDLVMATERELAVINQELKQLDRNRRMQHAEDAAAALLRDMAHGLERRQRREGWRTGHATDRAGEKTRPTGMAQRDIRTARYDRVVKDDKEGTFIVLGGKGRVHVLTPEGLHVTSLHMDGLQIQTRLAHRRWKTMERAAVEDVLKKARARLDSAEPAERTAERPRPGGDAKST